MSWADEPEDDRDLIERGSRVFCVALAIVLALLVAGIVTLPSWLAPLIHGWGGA